MDLYYWEARRAGGRITVKGATASGDKTKIVGVDLITTAKGGQPYLQAIDKDGVTHRLHLGAPE